VRLRVRAGSGIGFSVTIHEIAFGFLNGNLIAPANSVRISGMVDELMEIAMLKTRLKQILNQITPAILSLAAVVALSGACVAVGAAHAQDRISLMRAPGAREAAPLPLLNSVPPPPAPIFNPSIPYTVPQTPETPISPASPGSIFGPGY
jgi:hypothetical protein